MVVRSRAHGIKQGITHIRVHHHRSGGGGGGSVGGGRRGANPHSNGGRREFGIDAVKTLGRAAGTTRHRLVASSLAADAGIATLLPRCRPRASRSRPRPRHARSRCTSAAVICAPEVKRIKWIHVVVHLLWCGEEKKSVKSVAKGRNLAIMEGGRGGLVERKEERGGIGKNKDARFSFPFSRSPVPLCHSFPSFHLLLPITTTTTHCHYLVQITRLLLAIHPYKGRPRTIMGDFVVPSWRIKEGRESKLRNGPIRARTQVNKRFFGGSLTSAFLLGRRRKTRSFQGKYAPPQPFNP